jgi:hypothetical protein
MVSWVSVQGLAASLPGLLMGPVMKMQSQREVLSRSWVDLDLVLSYEVGKEETSGSVVLDKPES